MRELMAVANRITSLVESNSYCVFNNISFFAQHISYSSTQTVEDLRRMLNNLQGRLVHLGQTLRGGPLSEYGVRPGSFVIVYD